MLFPTGRQTEASLSASLLGVSDFTYEIIVSGEIASFLTPERLRTIIKEHPCDAAVVSGMCTADFSDVAEEMKIPVYRGTRHAADMRLAVPLILKGTLSTTEPADVLLDEERRIAAQKRLVTMEEEAVADFEIRGVKFGKNSRIKVLCEIMDAHRSTSLREKAERALAEGADGIDLGFGFDATEEDVVRCFTELEDLDCVLSVDTLSSELI
ncbi:MAG: dihydropteroate synthase, partial [Methanocorpusculum sp.]|nr:dihydropteroate synthase [Methanocorpusculum sp.]